MLTFIKCRAIHIGRHFHHLYHLITHERNVMTLHNCSKMCFRGIDSFQVCSLVFMVSIHSKVCSCVFMVSIHSKVCSCVFMVSIHSKVCSCVFIVLIYAQVVCKPCDFKLLSTYCYFVSPRIFHFWSFNVAKLRTSCVNLRQRKFYFSPILAYFVILC